MNYVILDRDGTLIRHIPYLCDPARVELLPTVDAGLRRLLASGAKLFLHTNQSGVGRGYFSLEDVIACNEEMLRQIGLGDGLFEGICICPEAPGQLISYRKPSPDYGLEIIGKYAVNKNKICYIGDNVTDLLTAKNIGCRGIGVNTGLHDLRQMLKERKLETLFSVSDTFLDAVNRVLSEEREANETN
jgi:D-glycero-D-manno-heptose 1,7-bisphosphate phosphatase